MGRSTHIGLLKQWLENNGHAVLDTGMTRSALAGKRLKQAKEGHTLGGITMSLFYATDFADRLENEIIPRCARASLFSPTAISIRLWLGLSFVAPTRNGFARFMDLL